MGRELAVGLEAVRRYELEAGPGAAHELGLGRREGELRERGQREIEDREAAEQRRVYVESSRRFAAEREHGAVLHAARVERAVGRRLAELELLLEGFVVVADDAQRGPPARCVEAELLRFRRRDELGGRSR